MEDYMKLKYITWIPAAIVMIIIFAFSAKPAEHSNDSSKIIAEQILNVYENITNNEYEYNVRERLIDKINHYVRKSAHFLEYALLGFCICFHLTIIKITGLKQFLYATALSALYASSDEIHQYFVPGRSCQLTDILLDSCGAATGALLLIFILYLINVIKRKR